jgi:ABC-type transporter Mla subunit MlaD
VGNDVRIKVTADKTTGLFDGPRKELTDLREQVTKDSREMAAATKRLEETRARAADATSRLETAEERLGGTLAENKSLITGLKDVEDDRLKRLREAADAAKALAQAEEILNRQEEQSSKSKGDTGPKFDMTKSFMNKDQLLSEAKSVGVQAGAVMGGAIGAGISTVGAAGLFVGIAAAAQSQNPQVAAAYKSLWEQVKAGAAETSSTLSSDFIKSAESLGRTFNALKPELVAGFAAAKPVIADVMDGIDRGARTAMPGLVTATKAAADASNGLADMMESAGRGVANFFTESSAGAKAGGDAFRSFGVIVERLGTFGGKMIAELANNSTNLFPRVEQTVNAAASAVENLAHVALPGLASGAGLALSGMTMLLNLASSLISALGPLAPAIGTFASSLKLVDMVSFGRVSQSWDALKTSVGSAEGFAGKAKAGFSSLLTGFGPLGLAAAGVALIMNELSKKEQTAAAAAAQHAKNVDSLADALRKSHGAVDASVRESAAQALSNTKVADTGKSVLDYARNAHVNMGMLTEAYLGNRQAQDQVIAGLDAQIEKGKSVELVRGERVPMMTAEGSAAKQLKDTLLGLNGTYGEAVQHNKDLMAAAAGAGLTVSVLAGDFKTLADDAASAEQQTAALMKIMDTMAGRKPDVEEATKAWEAMIDSFNAKDMNFDEKRAGSKKYIQGLVDASGQINLTTEDGRKLYDTVRQGEQDFEQTAVAMKNSGASADEIRAKLQTMREAFIQTAEKMGFTAGQAQLMADKFGLVPGNVSVIVSSNLSPEIQKAIELGGSIRALPDGSFIVTANTSAAQNAITKLIQTNDGRIITVHVNTVSGAQLNVSNGSFSRLKAAGGPVGHAAEGGARTGPVIVNEQGQEGARLPSGDLITLPMGSSVVPHSNMASMDASRGPARVEVLFGSDGSRIGDLLVEYVRQHVQIVGGGDVQVALGRAA